MPARSRRAAGVGHDGPPSEAPIVRLYPPQPLVPPVPIEPLASAAAAAPPGTHHPTGVRRLDHLLGGGIPVGGAILVIGPSFLGKRAMARRFCLANMARGLPSLTITCDQSAHDARQHLGAAGEGFAAAQEAGLDHVIDASGMGGAEELQPPRTTCTDDAMDMGQLAAAVRQRHEEMGGPHVAVLDSLSSLIAFAGPGRTFHFARTLLAQTTRRRGTMILIVDAHAHAQPELEMFKHLASGVVEVQADRGKPSLRVRGLGVPVALDWIEYGFSRTSFELTGSFSTSRIR